MIVEEPRRIPQQRPRPSEPKNVRDGYVPDRSDSLILDWELHVNKRERERIDKCIRVVQYLKRRVLLTTAVLILVIWQAWAQTQ